MATIQRPGKEGNATTYQGKVAAGYTNILAQEVDADIDAIYSAWNAGVDTINIKDASVTAAKLAPGAVTATALAPASIGTAALADSSITSAKIVNGTIVGADIAAGTLTDSLIASVAWTKLIAPLLGSIPATPRGALNATATYCELQANAPGLPSYDNTKPSYLVRLDYSGDNFEVWRAPATTGSPAYVRILQVTAAGRTVCNLADLSVVRNQIAVNAVLGVPVLAQAPSTFSLPSPNVWYNYGAALNITTRGGYVMLYGGTDISASGPSNGSFIWQRWLRDGGLLQQRAFQVASASVGLVVPVPGLDCVDSGAAAGAHTYQYQIMGNNNIVAASSGNTAGGFLEAIEIG